MSHFNFTDEFISHYQSYLISKTDEIKALISTELHLEGIRGSDRYSRFTVMPLEGLDEPYMFCTKFKHEVRENIHVIDMNIEEYVDTVINVTNSMLADDDIGSICIIIEELNFILAYAYALGGIDLYKEYCAELNPNELLFNNNTKLLEIYLLFGLVTEQFAIVDIGATTDDNEGQMQLALVNIFEVLAADDINVEYELNGRGLLSYALPRLDLLAILVNAGFDINRVATNGATMFWDYVFTKAKENRLDLVIPIIDGLLKLGADPEIGLDSILEPANSHLIISDNDGYWLNILGYLEEEGVLKLDNRELPTGEQFWDTYIGKIAKAAVNWANQ